MPMNIHGLIITQLIKKLQAKIEVGVSIPTLTAMSVPKILPEVLQDHMKEVVSIKALTAESDPLVKKIASTHLELLGSKAGNDILESVLVRATGREPKDPGQKHGADSKDGDVEAKPCKGTYSAHISDDTPNCLLKAQKIPYCILGVTSENGQQIHWAAIVPYRVFDTARYQKILSKLNFSKEEWPEELPTNADSRTELLNKLVVASADIKNKGIRSNPLPLQCLDTLSPSEYSVWVSDNLVKKVKPTKGEAQIIKMWKAQPELA
jgi:hypothetical protein